MKSVSQVADLKAKVIKSFATTPHEMDWMILISSNLTFWNGK
jgi:hypothetical protein